MMSKTEAYDICKHIREIMKDQHGSDSSYVEALGIVIGREEWPDKWNFLGFNGFGEEIWVHKECDCGPSRCDYPYYYCPDCGKRME